MICKTFHFETLLEEIFSRILWLVFDPPKKKFVESVIQSARAETNIDSLHCQNDVESLHVIEKRN